MDRLSFIRAQTSRTPNVRHLHPIAPEEKQIEWFKKAIRIEVSQGNLKLVRPYVERARAFGPPVNHIDRAKIPIEVSHRS